MDSAGVETFDCAYSFSASRKELRIFSRCRRFGARKGWGQDLVGLARLTGQVEQFCPKPLTYNISLLSIHYPCLVGGYD